MIEDRVKSVIATVTNIPANEIPDNASAETFEAWDSLRHITIILSLEEEFSIEFNDDEVTELLSLKSLCDSISKKIT